MAKYCGHSSGLRSGSAGSGAAAGAGAAGETAGPPTSAGMCRGGSAAGEGSARDGPAAGQPFGCSCKHIGKVLIMIILYLIIGTRLALGINTVNVNYRQ